MVCGGCLGFVLVSLVTSLSLLAFRALWVGVVVAWGSMDPGIFKLFYAVRTHVREVIDGYRWVDFATTCNSAIGRRIVSFIGSLGECYLVVNCKRLLSY